MLQINANNGADAMKLSAKPALDYSGATTCLNNGS
jgi:hypothetical protein